MIINKSATLITDGACSGNPGPGAWAYMLMHDDKVYEQAGYLGYTTNNAMELTAVIKGLQDLSYKDIDDLKIFLDSRYVLLGITAWIHNWKINGWRNSQKKPVLNHKLWLILDQLTSNTLFKIEWIWIKGHSTHELHNRVDWLARNQIKIHNCM